MCRARFSTLTRLRQTAKPYKGWPLIKLGRFEDARQSALRVLAKDDVDRFSEAQAWNTLCAVELSAPQESQAAPACDKALELDEAAQNTREELSTVTLTNAAEVALSRLRIDQAERLIDRATRYPNPSSVSNPWIQKLYLTLAQGRFDNAQSALEQMHRNMRLRHCLPPSPFAPTMNAS